MLRAWTTLSLALALATSDAFAGAFTMPHEPVVVVVEMCPVLRRYTPQFELKLKAELEQLRASSPGSALGQLIVDYRALRDACRAINNK